MKCRRWLELASHVALHKLQPVHLDEAIPTMMRLGFNVNPDDPEARLLVSFCGSSSFAKEIVEERFSGH